MKQKNRHSNKFLKLFRPWVFLVLALAFGYLGVNQLRANNEKMVELRSAVYVADMSGGDVTTALRNLQAYVTRHMNTNLQSGPNGVYPPIQLKYTYERLLKAQNDQNGASNSQIYTDAQKHCEQQNSGDFSGRNRVPCIQQYVSTHLTKGTKVIPDALYKFSFVSPRWSPDLAGYSLFLSGFFAVLFVLTFIYHRVVSKHWL